MPWCITCAELENPNWRETPERRLHHKYISWKEYFKHKFQKKYRGHDCYI